jgi:OmpA-OmpF porin, OOP family
MITVEGHTDRLGATRYNQELSLRRAEAVKAYLVSSGGISPEKIAATGVGEATSITTAQDCAGNASRAKLIVCLQPDRRVDIEVIGTR